MVKWVVITGDVSTQVVIIGAGQAGLSVAYYLRRFDLTPGVDFIIYDRGPLSGGAWQFRWDALRLGSAHRVNDLPGMAELGLSFSTANRELPARDIVAGYYRRYEEHFGLEVQRPVNVRSVVNSGADLAVMREDSTGGGQTLTRLLVNATGTWGAPFIPFYPGAPTFLGRHIHTSGYGSAQELEGKSVVVVGGGTSAIGFLLELEGVARQLTWVTRRPVEFSDPEYSAEGGVAAVEAQEAAARAGLPLPSIVSGTTVPLTRRNAAAIERGLLVARPMFTRIEENGVRFEDGSFAEADAIIWATGFRSELRHLSPLKLREVTGGVQVESGAVWQDPRIFLAGYGPYASTIGANRSGRVIARQVMAAL
jgi:putative flavoprotein involved in K+ transport